MPAFQNCELLPEHKIFQGEIPTTAEEANQCSDPEEKQAEHGTDSAGGQNFGEGQLRTRAKPD